MRTSKNVSLTEAGLMFMEDASSILKIACGAKKRLGIGSNDVLFLTVGCHNQSELDLLPLSYAGWQIVFPPSTPL